MAEWDSTLDNDIRSTTFVCFDGSILRVSSIQKLEERLSIMKIHVLACFYMALWTRLVPEVALKAVLLSYIKRGLAFSRCLDTIFPWRKCSTNNLVISLSEKGRVKSVTLFIRVKVTKVLMEQILKTTQDLTEIFY